MYERLKKQTCKALAEKHFINGSSSNNNDNIMSCFATIKKPQNPSC